MVKKSRAYSRPPRSDSDRKPNHFIRQWRERQTDEFPDGMSQEILAERSGLSVSSISAYERGTNDPSLDALQKLSHALGVPVGMLVDIDPTEEPELWVAYERANATQRKDMGRVCNAMIGPQKRK